jgi:hypothetical protein
LKAYPIICDVVKLIEKATEEALMDSVSSIAISGFGSHDRQEFDRQKI